MDRLDGGPVQAGTATVVTPGFFQNFFMAAMSGDIIFCSRHKTISCSNFIGSESIRNHLFHAAEIVAMDQIRLA
jgi:hypothetical protein